MRRRHWTERSGSRRNGGVAALAIASAALASALLAAGWGGQASGASGSGTIIAGAGPNGPTSVKVSDFVGRVDNPYFPLRPGTTFRYRGVKDGKPTVDVYRVTHEIKRILGVPCVSVKDKLYKAGRLAERTTDWYTQDRQGRVWYFGEATAELSSAGKVISTEGTWQAGRDGATPGIFMTAPPKPGKSYRQEYYKGHAEDHFVVVRLKARVSVPAGTYRSALLTREWTPLEPGVLDHKYYVRGIGEVSEESVKGPREVSRLVSVSLP